MQLRVEGTRRRAVLLSMMMGLVGLGLLLCFFVADARISSSQALRQPWKQVDLSNLIPSSVHLSKVLLVDRTTAWLVGAEPVVAHGTPTQGRLYKLEWQDRKWVLSEQYNFQETINDLYVGPDGSMSLLVTGETGVGTPSETYEQILRRDKGEGGWRTETGRLKDIGLGTIWMLPGGQEGWAGGGKSLQSCKFVCSESLLLHYTNGSWITDTTQSLTGRGIADLDFVEADQNGSRMVGYAVGEGIAKYDGQTWTKVSVPQLPPTPTAPPNVEACPGLYFDCLWFNKVRVLSRDEAWFFGARESTLSIRDEEPVLLHLHNGQWQVVMPGSAILSYRPPSTEPLLVPSFSMGSDGYGFLAASPLDTDDERSYPQILQVSPAGSLSYEQVPELEHTRLFDISNVDVDHAMAVGQVSGYNSTATGKMLWTAPVLLSYGYLGEGEDVPTRTPSPKPPREPVEDKHYSDGRYFPEVGHNVRGRFLAYWQGHGGLAQFGYPLTEEFAEESFTDGKTYTVQYFERAVFEYHPENAPPYDVLLSLLGVEEYHTRYPGGAPQQKPNYSAGSVYFPETGKRVGGSFLTYWRQFGGLPQQGYPITDEIQEQSKLDGKTYTVQYFQRAVMEWHPGFTPPNDVLLSQLGTFRYRERYEPR